VILPHFPVVKRDKTTRKVRMVLDALAKHENVSLNDAIDQGLKLQNELTDLDRKLRSCVTLEKCTCKWESLNQIVHFYDFYGEMMKQM